MVIGLGIDLVNVKRIDKIIERWGNRFLHRIYTPLEISYCQKRTGSPEHYAARFAAKEAAVKMLGGVDDAGWHDIEIRNDKGGRPEIILLNKVRKIADEKGIKRVSVSLSHEREMAVAVVIGEGD